MNTDRFSPRKPLLSLSDLAPAEVARLGHTAFAYGASRAPFAGLLEGARVGLLFTAPSTRTRTSYWSAATTLGCHTLHFGAADLQVGTGESWGDTGLVLDNYLDAAVVRTNGPQLDMAELARALPATINALSYEEHPTQAIADLSALRGHFGPLGDGGRPLRLAYLGLVNNTARALALLAVKTPGMTLDVYSPQGRGFTDEELKDLNARTDRDVVRQFDRVPSTPDAVDAVYTTRWQSMGVPYEDENWADAFRPFAVTTQTMSRFSKDTEAVFLHDLPAMREMEASSEVIDGKLSLVRSQAYHKESAAAAALLWALGDRQVSA
ncbi:ornithine carbamoyltransferase [Streptomyces spiroverticillatus]|uniref:Ornithine carbamoyltransferase n=1 Tax=Streptomyces finlayi TaxID=67296 RepID=A0A919CAT2_9ACTN|nr:ornithine carbamoyltransferase [Streptomyces finlayi]GHA11590.1 ornithine carbamoyltransferase [Streptomyces spiroverticillatus]GHC94944.1 ornithine carbamoyltransferase [Streptomyces finlayi]